MRRRTDLRHVAAFVIACAACLAARPASAQTDTLSIDERPPENHSPGGALWRAAAVPGWGQIYNGQYYKAPIVWAGIAGIAGSALYINQRYRLYRHAYFWTVRDNPNVGIGVPAGWENDYLDLIAEFGLSRDEAEARRAQLVGLFKQNRDNLRRNRDLFYIGIGLFYGLTILDAYVSAHLLDFDVSEDLALEVSPTRGGFAVRLRPGR